MSNLHNFPRVVTEMMSKSHHMTHTKHENRQTMETKGTCFCEESLIDRSFLVLELLNGGFLCASLPPLPMATQAKKANDE